jgi:hypothetical protein
MQIDHKLARLCWNDNGWKFPSGREGKTRNDRAFEFKYGFGHEEWLFDTLKVIGGFHYGYVRAISEARDRLQGQTLDLSLYTINDRTKQRRWLGKICNVKIVTEKESRRIYDSYEKRGWLDEMRSQIRVAGANEDAFEEHVTRDHFAVLKFKVEDLHLREIPLVFKHDDPAVTSDYYNLKNYIREPAFTEADGMFVFKSGHNVPADKKKLEYERHKRDVNNYHNHVQNSLFTAKSALHGADNVGTEINTGFGSRVDLIVRDGRKFALYEIKTGPSLQACVREALGQLLEYRHLIGHKKISKLVVVTPHPGDERIEAYLAFMRDEHHIPIHYEQCVG